MELSLDFGGSTLDAVLWNSGELVKVESIEAPGASWDVFQKFLLEQALPWSDIGRLYVTGGKSCSFPDEINEMQIGKVDEIDSIGVGGWYLGGGKVQGVKKCLVVSMGTGTCMVEVENGEKCIHIGGTGVGGGTFLGLAKELLGETDVEKLKEMFAVGDRSRVDLSVKDIIGGGIGIVSGDATASNLGKIAREIDFSKSDLASGMVNLIGQTIGITSVFGAKSCGVEVIVLTGKLTRIGKVIEVVKQVGDFYGMEMIVPEYADVVSAIGAYFVGKD